MEKEKEELKTHRVVELQEFGNRLPLLRTDPDGKPLDNQRFTFLTWDMPVEEKIAEYKSKSKTVGGLVSKILFELLDEFCGKDFQAMSEDQKILMINQMEFSNVLYMYVYLRVEELGSDFKLPVDCPSCNHHMDGFVADLNTFEIHVKDKDHPTIYDYELRRPIMMDKDVMITKVKIGHTKWDAMESATMEMANNEAKIKQLLIKCSIVGFIGEDGPIENIYDPKTFIQKLGKGDLELMSQAIQKHNCGPLMAVEGDCTACKRKWFKLLDWTYDFFYGSSSL